MKSFKKLVWLALIAQLCISSSFAGNMNMSNNVQQTLDSLDFNLDDNWVDTQNDVTNSDYNVDASEVKQWDLKITNGWAYIDGTLYVYWNLTVTNNDLKVKWKLKVTWNLIVTNWNIVNNWRIYVFGKKKVINWNTNGKSVKLTSNVAKFDPFLRADLTKEEFEQVQSMINDFYAEIETQKKELKNTFKNKWDVDSVKENIIKIRDTFYTDMEWFIQSEDIEKFNKIKNKEIELLNKFMDQHKWKELLSLAAKQLIIKKINSLPEEKREPFIKKIVENIDKIIESTTNENKKALLLAIKKVFEQEYEKYAWNIIENLDKADQSTPVSTWSNSTQVSTGSTSSQTNTWNVVNTGSVTTTGSIEMTWTNSTQVTTWSTMTWTTSSSSGSTMSM